MNFKVIEERDYTIIHFELKDNITPEILQKLTPPKVNCIKGVILSGRGPVWFYSYLTHHYHPTKFVAVYDPRLGGAVITESHSQNYKVGEILKIDVEN